MSYEVNFTTTQPVADELLDEIGLAIGYEPEQLPCWTKTSETTFSVDAYDCQGYRDELTARGYSYTDDGIDPELCRPINLDD